MISSANEGLQTSTPPLPSSDLITPSLIFSKIFHRYSHTLNPNPVFPFRSTQAQPHFLQLFNNSSLSHYFIKKTLSCMFPLQSLPLPPSEGFYCQAA
jgi:hypothetical protein